MEKIINHPPRDPGGMRTAAMSPSDLQVAIDSAASACRGMEYVDIVKIATEHYEFLVEAQRDLVRASFSSFFTVEKR